IILKTEYGETNILPIRYTDKIKPRTLFTTFHHSSSKINAIFGDEADELILTARLKSLKVNIILADSQIGCS
nr:hypothetical protein [Sulfurovaceae bacterium]